jgi:DNA transformation protein and related proteins
MIAQVALARLALRRGGSVADTFGHRPLGGRDVSLPYHLSRDRMPSVTPQYRDFILDLLAPLHPQPRGMFSGIGLFCDGAMFGLLIRDAFYLRVSDATRGAFERAGSGPFSYDRNGRIVSLAAYYEVPDGLLDQPDALLQWARDAIGAARAVRPRSPVIARRKATKQSRS